MEYKLIKTSEQFLIVSDERLLNTGEFYLDVKNNIVNKVVDTYDIKDTNYKICIEKTHLKVISQQEQIEFSALSEEEQKKIGYFNLNKFKIRQWNNYKPISNDISTENGFKDGLEIGFKKSQELLSDRMFTLEDMKLCYMQGWNKGRDGHSTEMNNYIQSLSQPKSWKIECVEKKGKVKILKLL